MQDTKNDKYNGVFKTILNENTAYWIGFLAADGSVREDKNCLSIGLAQRDRSHIEKFKLFINSNVKIFDRDMLCTTNGRSYPSSFIQIYDKDIVEDLKQYGLISNKSNQDIDFLQYIPEKYKIYFILGYFDGDGCFTITEKSRSFGVCGSKTNINSIVVYLQEFLHLTTSAQCHKYDKSDITYGFCDAKTSDINTFCEFYLKQNYVVDLLDRKVGQAELMIDIINVRNTDRIDCFYQKPGQMSAKPNTEKICPICGNVFYYRRGSDVGNYCSQECVHISQRRAERPSRDELKDLIRTTPFVQIGKMFNVSDNAIKKWCASMNLPSRVKDINIYSDEEWMMI